MMTQQVPLLKSLHSAPQQYLKELLGLYGPPAQSFRIHADQKAVLVGAQGARLIIPPFSMMDYTGRLVKGPVDLRLKEVYSQGEMMMASRPTTSEGRLMESGGQVMLHASQGHSPLRLAQPITVEIPLQKKLRTLTAMRLFTGSASTFHAYSSAENFDWRMDSGKPLRVCKAEGKKYYRLQLVDFNWAGCSVFVTRKSSRCMVTARPVSTVERFDSKLGYLVFNDIHAVARMYPGKHNCTAVNIPGKLSATAHVIGLFRGRLYYGSEVMRRASEKLVDVKMRPVLDGQLAETLRMI